MRLARSTVKIAATDGGRAASFFDRGQGPGIVEQGLRVSVAKAVEDAHYLRAASPGSRAGGTAPHSRFRDCAMLPSERADAVGFPKP